MKNKTTFFGIILVAAVLSSVTAASGYVRSTDGSGNPLSWEHPRVHMCINRDDFPFGSPERHAVVSALQAWNNVSHSEFRFQWSFVGGVSALLNSDGINAISFEDLDDDSALGMEFSRYHTGSHYYVETDIALMVPRTQDPEGVDWSYDTQGECNGISLKEVVIHELGHAFGLDHAIACPCIMNAVAARHYLGEDRDFVPNADDAAGVRAIYPASSGEPYIDYAAGYYYKPSLFGGPFEIRPPLSAETGGEFQMRYAVHNLGTLHLDVRVAFYLSKDQQITTSDILLRTISVSPCVGCASGACILAPPITLQVPPDLVPGYYYVGYIVDPRNGIHEADESNNRSAPCSGIQIDQGPKVYVSVGTNIEGLWFTVDGLNFNSRTDFVWDRGSKHHISMPDSQDGPPGTRYVWYMWSDGGGDTERRITANRNGPYTALFRAQYELNTVSDGNGTVSPASGWYNGGSEVAISATPNDPYRFAQWTGEGRGSYSGCKNPATIRMYGPVTQTALFSLNPPTIAVTIITDPVGRPIHVDGDSYTGPETFCWAPGSEHEIEVVSPDSVGPGVQYAFSCWSDGGAPSHRITAPSLPTTLTASFTKQYRLTMNTVSQGSVSPTTGWQDSGSVVTITAIPDCGFAFERWEGTGNGSYSRRDSVATVTMNGPISQTARFTVDTHETFAVVSDQALQDLNLVLAWIDYDADGDLDLVGSFKSGYYSYIRLVRNDGGSFTVVSDQALRDLNSVLAWIDYDADGDLDLLGNFNHPGYNTTYVGLARNDGGSFSVLSDQALQNLKSVAAWIDYDADGDLDLVGNFGSYTTTIGLLRNESPCSRYWLRLELAGIMVSESGLGTRIIVSAGDITQYRLLTEYDYESDLDYAQSGDAQQIANILFGLGVSNIVDMLTVHWPSGIVQQFIGIEANTNLRIEEERPPTFDTPPMTWAVINGDTIVISVGDTLTVPTGGEVNFFVDPAALNLPADVLASLAYQWKLNCANLRDTANVSGTTTSTLSITDVQPDHSGAYTAVLTSSWGSIESSPIELQVHLGTGSEDEHAEEETGEETIPNKYALSQNYPNPFNPQTVIQYSLPRDCEVQITIHNILGQKVRTLVNDYQEAGYHKVEWNSRNERGEEVASGIYFYKIKAGEFTQSKKMLILK